MKIVALTTCTLLAVAPLAHADSPYAGEERRAIKSLSEADIAALENGDGMGFAKLAELNSYPGPRHVLDLAAELDLSAAQLQETEALYEAMREDAVATGLQLSDAEAALDRACADRSVEPETLQRALTTIGLLRARLRYVHLEAHLRQSDVLTDAQVARYDELRGYGDGAQDHSQHDGHH